MTPTVLIKPDLCSVAELNGRRSARNLENPTTQGEGHHHECTYKHIKLKFFMLGDDGEM